jgi:RNA polymerase sigma-70 factor (ECF subfamily)
MELYSDTYYIQRIQAGDTASFACLLNKYSRPIHSLIFRLVRNREDAEELAQDVFMKVFKHLESFKGDSSFATWIYKIAYNTAISETRRRKHEFLAIEESMIENVSEERMADAMGQWSESEQTDHLEAALAALPPEERALVLFFYMEEKSVEETAHITGLSPSNVKTRLHRIRKKLFVLLTAMEHSEA